MQFNDLFHRRQRVPVYAQSEVATSTTDCAWQIGTTIENIAIEKSHNASCSESSIEKSHWYVCAWPHCWAAIIRSYACLTRQRRRQRLHARLHRRSRISLDLAFPKHCGIDCPRQLALGNLAWKTSTLAIPTLQSRRFRKNRLPKCHIHYYKPCHQRDPSRRPNLECIDHGMVTDHDTVSSKRSLSPLASPTLNTAVYAVPSGQVASPTKADHFSLGQTEFPGPISMDIWIPPINSKTLNELTVPDIFNSAQFRHDVIFDPNLTFRANLDGKSGKLKRRRAERYWRMVELAVNTDRIYKDSPTRFEYLKVIINEMAEILSSIRPPIAIAGMPRMIIEKTQVRKALDSDLLIQQLKHDALDVQELSRFLCKILSSACFPSRLPLVLYLQELFTNHHYGKAIRQCFTVIEAIKLDIANQALRQYRVYLVETCVDYELKHFLRQHAHNQVQLFSILDWLKKSWGREGKTNSFLDVYHSALVRLVTDDDETKAALVLQPISYPTTLHLDEYRITNQFRNEYQNIIVTAILLLPFHQLAGRYATKKDLVGLKNTLSVLLKKVIEIHSRDVMSDRVSSYDLVLEVCATAIRVRHRRQHLATPASNDALTLKTAHFWCQWLGQNLRPSSSIYFLMYHRIGSLLTQLSQSRRVDDSEFEKLGLQGLENDIRHLGGKLALVADINLRTFHILYAATVKRLSLMHFFDDPSE